MSPGKIPAKMPAAQQETDGKDQKPHDNSRRVLAPLFEEALSSSSSSAAPSTLKRKWEKEDEAEAEAEAELGTSETFEESAKRHKENPRENEGVATPPTLSLLGMRARRRSASIYVQGSKLFAPVSSPSGGLHIRPRGLSLAQQMPNPVITLSSQLKDEITPLFQNGAYSEAIDKVLKFQANHLHFDLFDFILSQPWEGLALEFCRNPEVSFLKNNLSYFFYLALYYQRSQVVDALLEKRYRLEAPFSQQTAMSLQIQRNYALKVQSPLCLAIALRNLRVVQRMLDLQALNFQDYSRCVMQAINLKDSPMTDLLCSQVSFKSHLAKAQGLVVALWKTPKENPNSRSLKEAAIRLAEALARSSWDLSRSNFLHVACQEGMVEVAAALLKNKKIDPNARDVCGTTPLHLALQNRHLELVKCLLQNGANANLPDPLGFTPLHIACQMGCLEAALELIDSHQAQVNAKSSIGLAPLHIACREGHLDLVERLIEKGATTYLEDNRGFTPLHYACQKGSLPIVIFLAQFQDDLDLFTQEDISSPLHQALKYDQFQVALYLMTVNIPYIKDKKGLYPLSILLHKKYPTEQFKQMLTVIFDAEKTHPGRLDLEKIKWISFIGSIYSSENLHLKQALKEILEERNLDVRDLISQEKVMQIMGKLVLGGWPVPSEFACFFQEKAQRDEILRLVLRKSDLTYRLCQDFPEVMASYLAEREEAGLFFKEQLYALPLLKPSRIQAIVSQLSLEQIQGFLTKERASLRMDNGEPVSAFERLLSLWGPLSSHISAEASLENAMQQASDLDAELLEAHIENFQEDTAYMAPFLLAAAMVNPFEPALKKLILVYFEGLAPLQQQAVIPLLDQEIFYALLMKNYQCNLLGMGTLLQKQYFIERGGLSFSLNPIKTSKEEMNALLKDLEAYLLPHSLPKDQESLKELAQRGEKIVRSMPNALMMAEQLLERQFKQALTLETSEELHQLLDQKKKELEQDLSEITSLFRSLEQSLKALQQKIEPAREIPGHYLCPINLEIMENPCRYSVSSGHFYVMDESALQSLKGNQESFTCPFTRETITSFEPLLSLKEEIAQFLAPAL
ncbi:MAG: ankyrin-3-like [Chlamydiales bacterium]|jgi:ankyrin repeat protein|nr:ankyrin-3-like [Chlamydiales bacterium]